MLSAELRRYMTGRSWHKGCPTALDDLRLVVVRFLDFDGNPAVGRAVVHRLHAAKIARVLEILYEKKFPLARLDLVDDFDGNDDLSTAANNSSGFNCRRVAGSKSWSQHAYGAALDLNPLQNPYVRVDGTVLDSNAKPFVDRSVAATGLIAKDSSVVGAFASIGWRWGGDWKRTKDYQHFSASGR